MLVPLSPHFVLCYLLNYPLRVVAKVQLPHPLLWSAKSNCPLTQFLHHGAGFRVTNSGLRMVRNIVFVSDKHTLIFQPSLTLNVLPLVTESTISTSFHYPCDNNPSRCISPFPILLRIWPSSCPNFVYPLIIDCLPSGTSTIFRDNLALSGSNILCCRLSSLRLFAQVCRCISYCGV